MNEKNIYDDFSQDYDYFIDWEARLSVEIPFITSELSAITTCNDRQVSVLDAACGTGQHVIALTEQGFDCAGADFSPGMVDIARKNAEMAQRVGFRFEEAGFNQLLDVFGKDSFDSLVCLGNSLPHILDESTLANTLADFNTIIRPDGMLIIQNRNFDKVLAERSRWMTPQTHRDNERTWVFNRFYDFEPYGRLTFNIQILYCQKGSAFVQRIISTRLWPLKKDLLAKFLQTAGFRGIKYYGDLKGSDFDVKQPENLVITARSALKNKLACR
jgi:glycine/sarcosine N-methyltransferase